ncbi:polyadenylate-binding protein-interacting protein 1 [Zeugodacus cucurbitae]|uniref:Polyadenylate-binding protein-interacting protein 1 n=1 Tax=Zeugodacus cucurbitae TaxID=28588 RepID=A0A0A1WK95_ZEUCU|nr:polyadenylate-binding protein-interacting protein 1 [Zeugodacus cucurbitae]XP_011189081.1 polyadenylate-binding protein-interacting protein 1 [Zeugodacus cucurbitae]
MDITPGRAPFTEDEDYTPLRKPKSATNTPTHGATSLNANTCDAYGRTVSPSKLSPYAKEFVPRFGGTGSNSAAGAQERLERHQQQYNQQTYQQYHQQSSRPHRYSNGYQQNNHHSHNQQQYGHQVTSLTASVQERLKIGSASGSSGNKNTANNYYSQNQSHQHPRHNKHHNQHHGGQGRYQRHNNSGASNSNAGSGSTNSDVETIALDYLRTVIQCLNQNPGQFDTTATRFLNIFEGMENNQYVLSNAMEDIFNESIQNPNFRYMGAKLYNLLHMLNLKKDSLFHTLLKCKLDYHQQEVMQYMKTNQQQKVRETALFLAELYMQLRGDDTRIHLIAENIVYSLKQLLSKESSDNIRCICLTLKLAGYDLTADCPIEMREIIEILQAVNHKSQGKYPLAANVISLQKNNWGRKLNSPTAEVEAAAAAASRAPEPLRMSDEPIFYGPDGRELTAEETDFLSDGAAAVPGSGSTDEDGEGGDLDIDLDPEMDEETEKAYKEFCKQNNAST